MKMHVDLKRIKPAGAVLILILSAIGIYMSFTVKLGVPQRYESRYGAEYYTQNADTMAQLLTELRENVLPGLDGVRDSFVSGDAKHIVVYVDKKNEQKVRAVLSRDFDENLFEIVRV